MLFQKIENRSENWLIAKSFIDGNGLKLAEKITEQVLNNVGYSLDLSVEIEYELFWKGCRDYCDRLEKKSQNSGFRNRALDFYEKNFNNLPDKIKEFNEKSNSPKLRINDDNYVVNEERLINNLYNTEIDIVIKAGSYLLIGEVKHTQTFGADSSHVLVHQLVRQYVMASILIEELFELGILNEKCTVIPFIIADENSSAKKTGQVKLLQHLKLLNEKNVISWKELI
jgi:hypothetical protein